MDLNPSCHAKLRTGKAETPHSGRSVRFDRMQALPVVMGVVSLFVPFFPCTPALTDGYVPSNSLMNLFSQLESVGNKESITFQRITMRYVVCGRIRGQAGPSCIRSFVSGIYLDRVKGVGKG